MYLLVLWKKFIELGVYEVFRLIWCVNVINTQFFCMIEFSFNITYYLVVWICRNDDGGMDLWSGEKAYRKMWSKCDVMSSLWCWQGEEREAAGRLPTGPPQSSGQTAAQTLPPAAQSTATASPGRTGRGESSGTATWRATGHLYLSTPSRGSSSRYWRAGLGQTMTCWGSSMSG